MKQFYLVLILAVLITVDSCAPPPGPPPPTTLNVLKTGGIMSKTVAKTDTNTYVFGLSCGCSFELTGVKFDTASIRYDTTGISVAAFSHTIKAYGKPGLATGTYYGSLAVVTLKPDVAEDFRDTLRDTVIVK